MADASKPGSVAISVGLGTGNRVVVHVIDSNGSGMAALTPSTARCIAKLLLLAADDADDDRAKDTSPSRDGA